MVSSYVLCRFLFVFILFYIQLKSKGEHTIFEGESVWQVKLSNMEDIVNVEISRSIKLPNLIEIQTKSYDWFLKEGLLEMFREYFSN